MIDDTRLDAGSTHLIARVVNGKTAETEIVVRRVVTERTRRRELDGLGGGISSLSKAGIIGRAPAGSGADVTFKFAQVDVTRPRVEFVGNCGNISSAIGPFAIDEGWVPARPGITDQEAARHCMSPIRPGWAAEVAKGDIIVLIDADGSHEPRDIPRLTRPIIRNEADLVVASRIKGGSDEFFINVSGLVRQGGGDLIAAVINYRFKTNLTDILNGFRAIRRSTALKIKLKADDFDIEHEMAHLTLSVIWRLLFGRDVGSEADTIREAITVGQRLIKLQYDSLLESLTPLWVPTKLHRQFVHGHRSMEAMIRQMIEERRTASHQNDDVLALLLAARDAEGCPLSDEEIRDELVTFLLAGHETTANALTWTWFLLSQFRSVRERLTHELNEVLGARLPTAADVPRLRYTKMVWEESLRLYPPAWSLHTRVAHAEDRLPSGAVLPPRAWVFISPWSLHRNAQWFPDPNRFDPERFSEEAQRTRRAFTYIPFGAGGRRRLGESFAELEGLLILATIASTVRLRLVDGQTIQPDPVMTLRPNVPVQMTVQRSGITEPHPIVA